jgi:hypothetical protein
MQLSIKSNHAAVQKAIDGLPQKVGEAAESAGAVLAAELAAKIRSMIPKEGGWFDVYRHAVDFIEISPTEWGIAGIAQLSFDQVEADKSLLWFQGGDEGAQILGQYNPWVIDALPCVVGGIASDVLVRPASESEVDFHRERLQSEHSSISAILTRVGKKVSASGLPTINGSVMADIDFLTRRLEFGLGGFPRTPIWATVAGHVQSMTDGAAVTKAFDNQLNGDGRPPETKHNSKTAADIKHGAQ